MASTVRVDDSEKSAPADASAPVLHASTLEAGRGEDKAKLITLEEFLRSSFASVSRVWPTPPYAPPSSNRAPQELSLCSAYVQHDGVSSQHAFSHPFSTLWLADGGLLVADHGHHRIVKLSSHGGELLGQFGPALSGTARRLRYPLAIALGTDGVYVTTRTGRFHHLSLDGRAIRCGKPYMRENAGGADCVVRFRLCDPYGLAVSSSGDILVAESGRHRLLVLRPTGELVRHFGTHGSLPGQFDEPRGLAIVHERVWVCDMSNHRLQCVSLTGSVLKLVGRYGDGPAEFRYPVGITVARELLLVSEYVGGRLHVLSTHGAFLQVLRHDFSVPAARTTRMQMASVSKGHGCASGDGCEGSGAGAVYLYGVSARADNVCVTDALGRVHRLKALRAGATHPQATSVGQQAAARGPPGCSAANVMCTGAANAIGTGAADAACAGGATAASGCAAIGAGACAHASTSSCAAASKRPRACTREATREARVARALEAVDLRGVLDALEPSDVQALLPAAYADAARHPEYYHLLPARPPVERLAAFWASISAARDATWSAS